MLSFPAASSLATQEAHPGGDENEKKEISTRGLRVRRGAPLLLFDCIRYTDSMECGAKHGGCEGERTREMKHFCDPCQREYHQQPIDNVRADTNTTRDNQSLPMLNHDLFDRQLHLMVVAFQVFEHRSLVDSPTKPQPNMTRTALERSGMRRPQV